MNKNIIAVLVLGLSGFTFSLLLAFLSKKLKTQTSPLLEKISSLLPGINCGACGFSGCTAFAEAIIKEKSIFKGCLPGGSTLNEKLASELGINSVDVINKSTVICHCQADNSEKKISANYQGPKTCIAAEITAGVIDCAYGCLGFGDCAKQCPVGAITVRHKKIYIDSQKCIACGKCIIACPRNLLEIIPLTEGDNYFIGCNNKDTALKVRKVCSRSCIGCGICSRIENSPYTLKDNLSYIDNQKTAGNQLALNTGKQKCPTKCIFVLEEVHGPKSGEERVKD